MLKLIKDNIDLFISRSVEPEYFLSGILIVLITGIILLIAVAYKFFEHFNQKEKVKTNKKHFNSTLLMTVLVLFQYNFWNTSTFQLKIQNEITKLIWFYSGIFLVFFSLIVHIIAKINIKHFWSDSIEIKEEHKLVTSGVYSLSRHPMYGSLILWCIGASLVMFNPVTILFTLFIFTPLMYIRAKAEEEELIKLDDEYIIYKQNVKMFFPTLKGYVALTVKIIMLIIFIYFMIKGINLAELTFLFTSHLICGYALTPQKVAFSYRSKSGIIVITWLLSKLYYPIIYFLWFVILMLIYGLKWNCPCMYLYEKFGGCPCLRLFKKSCNKGTFCSQSK